MLDCRDVRGPLEGGTHRRGTCWALVLGAGEQKAAARTRRGPPLKHNPCPRLRQKTSHQSPVTSHHPFPIPPSPFAPLRLSRQSGGALRCAASSPRWPDGPKTHMAGHNLDVPFFSPSTRPFVTEYATWHHRETACPYACART